MNVFIHVCFEIKRLSVISACTEKFNLYNTLVMLPPVVQDTVYQLFLINRHNMITILSDWVRLGHKMMTRHRLHPACISINTDSDKIVFYQFYFHCPVACHHIYTVVTIIAAFYHLVAATATVLLLDIDYLDAMTVSL